MKAKRRKTLDVDRRIMVIAAYSPRLRKHTIENFLNNIVSDFKFIAFLTRSNTRFKLSKKVVPYIRPMPRRVVNKYIGIILFFVDTFKLTIDCCQLVKKHNINLCVSFWTHWQAGLTLLLTKYICKTPYVLRIAGPLEIASLGHIGRTVVSKLSNYLLKQIIKSSALTISISEQLKNYIKKNVSSSQNVIVIPYGVDVNLFRPLNFDPRVLTKYSIPPKKKLVIYAGRIVKQKGIDYLIDAIPKVLSKMKSCHFLVVGDGLHLKHMMKRAREKDLSNHITFTGTVIHKEMPSFYNGSSVFILPSLTEGVPMAVLEAMACGVPVITTELPWTCGLITHKENGYLIPPRDSDAVASSILELLLNERLTRELGSSGRTTVLKKYNDVGSEARSIAKIIKKLQT